MKKTFLTLAFLIFTMLAWAQNGALSEKQLTEIRNSYKPDREQIAISNALSGNEAKKLAKNTTEGKKEDHFFKYEVKTKGITDQESSGRCWLFTSLNVFRPVVIDKYNLSKFEFSQNYLYFWHIFEKANLFLENVMATANEDIYSRKVSSFFSSPVDDGGAWNDFVNLVKKYGAVPKNIMPETYQSNHTGTMIKMINLKLRKDGLILRQMVADGKSKKDLEATKIEMLKEIYKILAMSLGVPPTEFQWRYKDKDGNISDYKSYTPISFWEQAVGINVDDYIMFIDDPTRPYYKLYERENERNVYEGTNWLYINMPASELKKYALASLKDNSAMYFSCDVGKYYDGKSGTLDLNNFDFNSLYGTDFSMTKAERMMTHQSGSTHGMALVGVDVDKDGNPVKWKLENSWGSSSGHNGYLTMTDEWFEQYMFRLVINKKYLDDKVLKILKQKPEKVPYYNPAFSDDQ